MGHSSPVIGMALLASLISIRLGISVALIEILPYLRSHLGRDLAKRTAARFLFGLGREVTG